MRPHPPTPPNRRPIQPKEPFLDSFPQWVCSLATTPPQTASSPPPIGGNDAIQGSDTPATRRQRASHGAKPPTAATLKCTASPTRPGHSTGWREKTRPAQPLHRHFREKLRPASANTLNLGHFERAGRTFSRSRPPSDQAGRTFSRTRHDTMATLKPTTPLLTPNKEPLKPASPLPPKNAPKTPVSHTQRR